MTCLQKVAGVKLIWKGGLLSLQSGVCRKFIYGGCGGTGNNFMTKAECEDKCRVKKPQSKNGADYQGDGGGWRWPTG